MKLHWMVDAAVLGVGPAIASSARVLLPPQPQLRRKALSPWVHEQEGLNLDLHKPGNSHTIGALSQIQATLILVQIYPRPMAFFFQN